MVKRIVAGASEGEHRSLLTLIEVLRSSRQFEGTSTERLLVDGYEAILDACVTQRQKNAHNEEIQTQEGLILDQVQRQRSLFAAVRVVLKAFVLRGFHTLYASKKSMDHWRFDAVVDCLEQSTEGNMPSLIINFPPRQPGNVRELKRLIERAALLCTGRLPTASGDLNLDCAEPTDTADQFRAAKARVVQNFEKSLLEQLLTTHCGNVTHAVQTARKNRRAFYCANTALSQCNFATTGARNAAST